jgi:hypothetical protein
MSEIIQLEFRELRFDDSHKGHELFGEAVLRGLFTYVTSKKLWPGSYCWCVKAHGTQEAFERFSKTMGKRLSRNQVIGRMDPIGA